RWTRLRGGGARIHPRPRQIPRNHRGYHVFRRQQADGGVRRGRRCRQAAASEILTSRYKGITMIAGRIPSAFGGRGVWLAGALSALLLAIGASFALNFPALTGRIVDQANIIQPANRVALASKLDALESNSGIQLMDATV